MGMQNSEDFYDKLVEFDSNKSININYVKEILYKFSYCNLKDCFTKPDLIRKSVINYLYSGQFELKKNADDELEISAVAVSCLKNVVDNLELEKLNKKNVELAELADEPKNTKEKEKLKDQIKKLEESIKKKKSFLDFYNTIHSSWENIYNEKDAPHQNLITLLKSSHNKIKYLLVYEAPPYDKEENYFLSSNGGAYGTPIKECFHSLKKTNIIDILVEKNVGFFDLIMAGIPIADATISIDGKYKPIRYWWSTHKEWKVGDKQLPVILFELGIFNLLVDGLIFEDRPLIAIGAPVNTSSAIFEFYSKQYLAVYKKKGFPSGKDKKDIKAFDFGDIIFNEPIGIDFEEIFTVNLSLINTPSTFEIRGTKGVTYPLFKANIIGSSNLPSGELLKNAFNII